MSFGWHPQARLFAGGEILRGLPLAGRLEDRPEALARIGAADFRIGGPEAAPQGFETLTGGTSGQPRRISRTVASWQASFAVNAGLFGIGPGMRVAVLGQLVHSLPLYGALESLHLGAEVHLLAGLSPRAQGRALAGMDLCYATPAQMRLILEAEGPEWGLRHLVIGGSKLDPGLRALLAARAPGCAVHEFYGAAEASFITLSDDRTPEASVGRPYPGVELRVEAGEILVRSPYLFRAYASDPGPARWQGEWLAIGERGELRDGYLYLRGREARMVKIADQAVWPEEMEAFLLRLPGVTRAAVTPRPDGLRGTVLVAHVMGEAEDGAILLALRAQFGTLKAPKAILRPGSWPLLPSGKTDLAAFL